MEYSVNKCHMFCRQKILLDLAHKEGYSKVMLGDCSTRLAVRLLTDISEGRGAHVAMDTVSGLIIKSFCMYMLLKMC